MKLARQICDGTPNDVVFDGHSGNQPDVDGQTWLAPVEPGTVFGMARNTGLHDRALPPRSFLKAVASVVGPGAEIPVPDMGRVDAEAELAVVIGSVTWQIAPGAVRNHVRGFTVAIDVTGRDAQASDPLWTEAKSRRGFTPLGPWVDTAFEPGDAALRLWRNGMVVASGSVGELARGVAEVVSYLSTLVELRPNDVILTGAPGTSAEIVPGDTVTAEILGLGSLSCPVVTSA